MTGGKRIRGAALLAALGGAAVAAALVLAGCPLRADMRDADNGGANGFFGGTSGAATITVTGIPMSVVGTNPEATIQFDGNSGTAPIIGGVATVRFGNAGLPSSGNRVSINITGGGFSFSGGVNRTIEVGENAFNVSEFGVNFPTAPLHNVSLSPGVGAGNFQSNWGNIVEGTGSLALPPDPVTQFGWTAPTTDYVFGGWTVPTGQGTVTGNTLTNVQNDVWVTAQWVPTGVNILLTGVPGGALGGTVGIEFANADDGSADQTIYFSNLAATGNSRPLTGTGQVTYNVRIIGTVNGNDVDQDYFTNNGLTVIDFDAPSPSFHFVNHFDWAGFNEIRTVTLTNATFDDADSVGTILPVVDDIISLWLADESLLSGSVPYQESSTTFRFTNTVDGWFTWTSSALDIRDASSNVFSNSEQSDISSPAAIDGLVFTAQ
jgi:hypothetical protein